jgi:hypothetical protein
MNGQITMKYSINQREKKLNMLFSRKVKNLRCANDPLTEYTLIHKTNFGHDLIQRLHLELIFCLSESLFFIFFLWWNKKGKVCTNWESVSWRWQKFSFWHIMRGGTRSLSWVTISCPLVITSSRHWKLNMTFMEERWQSKFTDHLEKKENKRRILHWKRTTKATEVVNVSHTLNISFTIWLFSLPSICISLKRWMIESHTIQNKK